MIKQVSFYLLAAASVCLAATAQVAPIDAANEAVVVAMRAEAVDPASAEQQIVPLEETFPSAESALAAVSTAQAAQSFEH